MSLLKNIYRCTVYNFILRPLIIYSLGSTVSALVTYFFENRKLKAVKQLKKGFEDHRQEVSFGPGYDDTLKRIADAYKKAKEDQEKVTNPPYQVGGLWKSTLDEQYAELDKALRNYDTPALKKILENFSREQFSANQGGGVDYVNIKKKSMYKYLFINTWYKYYNLCKDVTGKAPDLTYPLVGNPAGLYFDGKVIPIEAIRFHYCATQMLLLLQDIPQPVICEIGGGNGGEVYAVLSQADHPVTYIDLDIPEMMVISSYFLMTAFPEKRFLLYGEGNQDPENIRNYDVVMIPHFKMPELDDEMVDLFFNQRSFSEMNGESVKEYVHQIERMCRRYFMHINHSRKFRWEEDGIKTENLPAVEVIPDASRYKKVYDYPWMLNRLEEEFLYKGTGYVAFLYEKRKV